MPNVLNLVVLGTQGTAQAVAFKPSHVFNGSFAGRDSAEVAKHIEELKASGLDIPQPKQIPSLYAIGCHLMTTDDRIQTHGDQHSGEIEYALLWHDGDILLSVGSDHSDLWLEQYSTPKSKNLCQNVMSPVCWRYADVAAHFGQLRLDCEVQVGGKWKAYQRDGVAALLPPSYWIEDLVSRVDDVEGLVFFSGTINALDGLATGEAYRIKLTDPILDRSIQHEYACEIITAIEDI